MITGTQLELFTIEVKMTGSKGAAMAWADKRKRDIADVNGAWLGHRVSGPGPWHIDDDYQEGDFHYNGGKLWWVECYFSTPEPQFPYGGF